MANNFFKKERQKYFLVVFIGIILVIFVIMYQQSVAPEESSSNVFQPKEISINFSALESDRVKNLQEFLDINSFEGTIGRPNPFLPY
jgi:hypothetical protein